MSYKFEQSIYLKDKRYRIRANSQKELIEKIEKKKASCMNVNLENMTVKEWATKYIETYRVESQHKALLSQCKFFSPLQHRPLTSVKPIELQKLLNDFAKGKAVNTIKKYFQLTKAIFKSAHDHNLTYSDICSTLTMPKGEKMIARRSLTNSELELIEKAIQSHPLGHFMAIMLYCGLRPNEVKVLQWKDIDFSTGFLTVNKALKGDGSIGSPKSDSGVRLVPIPSVLTGTLKAHQGKPFNLVCPNHHGNMHTRNSYRRMWESFKREMHIHGGGRLYRNKIIPPYVVADDLVLYCLRHTYCTNLQSAGVPINVARELMGHADISTTAQIYTHSSQEALESARDKINNFVQHLSSKLG